MDQLILWFDDCSSAGCLWYVKRLSGNDTLANGTHQAGPYIPKNFLFEVFPEINQRRAKNPDVWVMAAIDSGGDQRKIRVVWYNQKTRDETRMTNFGGKSSELLNPENTGALAIFSFCRAGSASTVECRIWVCRDEVEENFVEDRLGPVEPGNGFAHTPHLHTVAPLSDFSVRRHQSCWLERDQFPDGWFEHFPSGQEIINKVIEMRPGMDFEPDQRLLQRRECEYQLFQSLEEARELPVIKSGYHHVGQFIDHAQTILQRRKSRAGRSLELHARSIFLEEGLKEGLNFSYQQVTEGAKRPDFLFPSIHAYQDISFPDDKLRILAVKTTCKDRWRQVLNEADRIEHIHLLTLQEGVSEGQFREMSDKGVQLVVPSKLQAKFKRSIRPYLQTFQEFIEELKSLGTP